MQFDATNQFENAYLKHSRTDKRHGVAAIERFSNNPSHPGLAVEKVTTQGSAWNFRASRSIRCTFEWEGAERILLRNVGGHEVFRSALSVLGSLVSVKSRQVLSHSGP